MAADSGHGLGGMFVTAWALVTDDVNGQSRAALAAVRALTTEGLAVAVLVSERSGSIAAASRGCHRVIRGPGPADASYCRVLHEVAGEFDVVFPSSDLAVGVLGGPGADLLDKSSLAHHAAAAGLTSPPSRTFSDGSAVLDHIDELTFPLVAKVSVKVAGVGASTFVASFPHELTSLRSIAVPLVIQPRLPGRLQAVSGVVKDGRLIAACHQRYQRIWPREGGVATSAVTVEPDLDLEERLTALVGRHDGVFQVQLLAGHVIDVNPRIYGSLPLAVAAGANLPVLAARGGTPGGGTTRARAGVRYRWTEGDVRHLAAGLRSGDLTVREVATALRPRRGTVHSVGSLRDPLPTWQRLRYVGAARRRAVHDDGG